MPDVKTDLELIAEFKKGNQHSFEELVGRYSDKAFNLAMRFTHSPEDAEEVLQDVFVTVYRKISGFEGKSSFSSWLYRVTVNAALMKIRKRKQDQTLHLEDLTAQGGHLVNDKAPEHLEVDKIAARQELAEFLDQAIAKLPDDYRPVFIMRDVDGLSSREVSKILNLSVPAVKSRLHRSRLRLKKSLQHVLKDYPNGTIKVAGNY